MSKIFSENDEIKTLLCDPIIMNTIGRYSGILSEEFKIYSIHEYMNSNEKASYIMIHWQNNCTNVKDIVEALIKYSTIDGALYTCAETIAKAHNFEIKK